ncbi:MAG: hypothetical protein KDD67_06930 [Ignavibacteriae bacterium]|nr:hypothetical protein [Ignavibacteriota bacterium]MCB9215211.1 hypothetical protein [Ignavibacteria bacterium]
MRSLTFIVFLFASLFSLSAQSIETDSIRYGWGPGVVGECVDASELHIRLQSRPYVVAGNSLYEVDYESTGYIKVMDFNTDVRCIGRVSWDYLSIWTNDEEYRYYPDSALLERFTAYGLLSPFLFHPIKDIAATRGAYGCTGHTEEHITHAATKVEDTVPSLKYEHTPVDEGLGRKYQINGIRTEELSRILRAVNLDPIAVSSLRECKIQEEDLAEYVQDVESRFGNASIDRRKRVVLPEAEIGEEEAFYLRLIPSFDTVNSDIVRAAIVANYESQWPSFGGDAYSVDIINEANDTIQCRSSSGGSTLPYNMPWTVRYNGAEFVSFNVELAYILTKMLWNDGKDWQVNPEVVHNPILLWTIANYLFREHQASHGLESPE